VAGAAGSDATGTRTWCLHAAPQAPQELRSEDQGRAALERSVGQLPGLVQVGHAVGVLVRDEHCEAHVEQNQCAQPVHEDPRVRDAAGARACGRWLRLCYKRGTEAGGGPLDGAIYNDSTSPGYLLCASACIRATSGFHCRSGSYICSAGHLQVISAASRPGDKRALNTGAQRASPTSRRPQQSHIGARGHHGGCTSLGGFRDGNPRLALAVHHL
jgi:hypothetical protein